MNPPSEAEASMWLGRGVVVECSDPARSCTGRVAHVSSTRLFIVVNDEKHATKAVPLSEIVRIASPQAY